MMRAFKIALIILTGLSSVSCSSVDRFVTLDRDPFATMRESVINTDDKYYQDGLKNIDTMYQNGDITVEQYYDLKFRMEAYYAEAKEENEKSRPSLPL